MAELDDSYPSSASVRNLRHHVLECLRIFPEVQLGVYDHAGGVCNVFLYTVLSSGKYTSYFIFDYNIKGVFVDHLLTEQALNVEYG